MKVLLDANLSWRIRENLKIWFKDCIHVDNCALNVPSSDLEIWNYAKENQRTSFTNDLDFINLVNLHGFLPKCVILRTGNQLTLFLTNLIIARVNDIMDFYLSEKEGILEIY
jgi:predicted nuclease of predicted toxin-antitoxin system